MNTMRAIMAMSLVAIIAGTAMADEFLLNPGFESGSLEPWQALPFQGGSPTGLEWRPWQHNPAEGEYTAMGFGHEAMLLQNIEPTHVADVTGFSLQVRQEFPWPGGDYEYGIVCRFQDPTGSSPYIEGVKWYEGDFLEWTTCDGLLAIEDLSSLVEGAGPNGPELMAVGIVGTIDAMTHCDAWTLTAVPEPASLAFLTMGALTLLRRRRF